MGPATVYVLGWGTPHSSMSGSKTSSASPKLGGVARDQWQGCTSQHKTHVHKRTGLMAVVKDGAVPTHTSMKHGDNVTGHATKTRLEAEADGDGDGLPCLNLSGFVSGTQDRSPLTHGADNCDCTCRKPCCVHDHRAWFLPNGICSLSCMCSSRRLAT